MALHCIAIFSTESNKNLWELNTKQGMLDVESNKFVLLLFP